MTPHAELSQVMSVLRRNREVGLANGVEFVGIVGSLARGQANSGSDVDVIVRQVGVTTLFRLAGLEEVLEREVGRRVDLVFSETMKPDRRAYIERDLVVL